MCKTLPQRGVGYSTLNSIENGMILPDQTRNPNCVNNLEAYLRYGPMSTITNAGFFFFFSLFLSLYFFRALCFLFIFNWRIVILQCCFGFCHMSTWISHRHTYVSSLWDLPLTPSPCFRWSQSTWFEPPVSYSKVPLLAILHTCVLVALLLLLSCFSRVRLCATP